MDDSCVLILTNSGDATTDYLCERLMKSAVGYHRLDTDTALESLQISLFHQDMRIEWNQGAVATNEISAVVYRRPKPFTANVLGDKWQSSHASDEWAEALEGFLAHVHPSKWLNYPPRNFMASHKVEQLSRACECGLRVPDWIVTNTLSDASRFLSDHDFDVVAKPLASGYLERDNPANDSLIYTQAINRSHMHLLDRLPGCPVLFQDRVKKTTDIRLVVVDDGIVAVSLTATDPDGLQRLDIRRDNMHDVRYSQVGVPDSVAHGVMELMRGYGLRFAAIDFAIDSNGRWVFFEVNPNGQWAWLDLVGASDIASLFIEALAQSARRE